MTGGGGAPGQVRACCGCEGLGGRGRGGRGRGRGRGLSRNYETSRMGTCTNLL